MRRALLTWYRRSHRDLPWRRTRDPYRIWLSETMLQQTRVETVIPYYERFLTRFPTLETLATADEQDVLREWAGLGYYARARNLKRAAELVVRDHDGRVPCDAEALRALPGVGPYTTGALRSIAFDERAGIVDGNVERVVARVLARSKLARSELWQIAEELVPSRDPGAFNQALMELGATVCTPHAPSCPRCPLRRICAAHASGRAEAYPGPRVRTRPLEVQALAGVLIQRGRLLLVRRPSRGLLGGLWETPSVEGGRPQALTRSVKERTGIRTAAHKPLGRVRHVFSHRTLTLDVLPLERLGGRLQRSSYTRWCTPAEISSLPLSTLMKKVLELTLSGGDNAYGEVHPSTRSRGA